MFLQESVPLAVQFVEGEIRRLLEGGCELSEMVMTGGLWRVTGIQIVTKTIQLYSWHLQTLARLGATMTEAVSAGNDHGDNP